MIFCLYVYIKLENYVFRLFSWLFPHDVCMEQQPAYFISTLSYLRIQSRARMKKSLLSWCSSRRRAHCSNVTDMDVRSLALLQLVNLMPFNLRQIWREVEICNVHMHGECILLLFLFVEVTLSVHDFITKDYSSSKLLREHWGHLIPRLVLTWLDTMCIFNDHLAEKSNFNICSVYLWEQGRGLKPVSVLCIRWFIALTLVFGI